MNNYFESEEFREILASYEEQLARGESPYFDADDFADIADNYLSTERPKEAMDAILRGLAIHPDDEVLLTSKSSILIFNHDFEEARECIVQNKLKGNDILYQKAQLAYALDNDISKAERMFRKWLNKEMENLSGADAEIAEREAYLHIVSSFVELHRNALDLEPEVTLCRRWIEEYMNRFEPLGKYDADITITDICRHTELSDLLVRGLAQVLDEQPYLKNGWSTLALGYFTLDKFEQAIEATDFALAIEPHDIEAMLTRAYSHNYLGQKEEARQYFEKYFEEGGADAVQGIPYADALACCGEKETALSYLQMGEAALEREFIDARDKYGQNDGVRFEEAFRRYMQAMGDAVNVYNYLERFDEAERCTRRILDLEPHNPEYIFMLGNFQLAQNKIDDAISTYSFAVFEAHDKIMMSIDIALTLVMNNYDEFALEMLKSIDALVKKNPYDSPSIKNIPAVKSLTYLKLGQKDLFLHNFKFAIYETPSLIEHIFKDYFPEGMRVSEYYDYAVEKIKEFENENKE